MSKEIVIKLDYLNPKYWYKKIVAAIRQQDKINRLEAVIKEKEEELKKYKEEIMSEIEKYKAETQVSLDLALEEENKRKEIERKLQKEIINLKEKLDKYYTNPYIKEIIKKNNKEIETLASFIPNERTQEPLLKLSQVHPREEKYIEFLKSLKNVPYVTAIIDKEAKEAKYSRISRIELEEILLIYVHNSCGYRVTVKTTAQTITQQYYIAELIKRTFNFH
ncbi:MAG: hypothetical protein QW625_02135 [Candidatus Nanoarchaeia archaeon]